MPGGLKEVGSTQSKQGVVAAESVRFRRPLGRLPQMGIDRSRNPNPELARVLSIPFRETHGVSTRKGTTTSRPLPSVPSFEPTEIRGDNNAACQGAFISDSLNDQQWSDHLPGPSSHQITCLKIAAVGKHEPES